MKNVLLIVIDDICRYPLHARCWTLTERVPGHEVIEHLGILIEAFRRIWKDFPQPHMRYFVTYAPGSQDDDPTYIRELRRLLSASHVDNRVSFGLSRRLSAFPRCRLSVFDLLPLEIKYMILDQITYRDITRFLYVLRWNIPDSYWRVRFPKDMIYEFDGGFEATDWCLFYIHAESILDEETGCRGLKNLSRILDILKSVKALYDDISVKKANHSTK